MMSLPAESAVLESPSEVLEPSEAPTKGRRTRSQNPAKSGVSHPKVPISVENSNLCFSEVASPPSSNPYLRPIHLLNAGLTFAPYERDWYLSPEERELVSSSISQTWTDQAMKCYMCAADCGNCDIPKGQYSFVCQMNKVVPVLLENIGQPDPHRLKRIFPQGYPHSAY